MYRERIIVQWFKHTSNLAVSLFLKITIKVNNRRKSMIINYVGGASIPPNPTMYHPTTEIVATSTTMCSCDTETSCGPRL